MPFFSSRSRLFTGCLLALFGLLMLLFLTRQPASLHAATRPVSPSAQIPARFTAIVGATVIDGTGAAPQKLTVLLEGERISAVAPKIALPAQTRVIDATGMTLLPGLFDLHTHLPYASGGGVSGDWPKNLQAYLYCGVTSVVDFGTYAETFEPMRRLIKTGVVLAPRLTLASRITVPGGHGAEGGRGDFFSLDVTSPREARAAIRRLLPYQPDAIKAFTDGWRYGASPDMPSMNEATLAALVEEAHKHSLPVLTHTVTLAKAKEAARAKVDVIAHGIGDLPADAELIELFKQNQTTYAPTLAVYEPRGRDILTPLLQTVLEPAVRQGITPPLVAPQNPPLKPAGGSAENGDAPRLRRWATLQKNTAALRQAGITFGVGTDAGVTGTHHGWATLRELQLLVAGGLTPLEAITAATSQSAKAIRVAHERGTIAVGKLADLVLVAGAPHERIADIENIKHVWLDGRLLDREQMAQNIAAATMTALPAQPLAATAEKLALLDNFESANGRSALDTLWVNATDAGVDASRMLFGRSLRAANDHALLVSGRLGEKERPYLRVTLPLRRGGIEPADLSAWRGVEFDVRGEGAYSLITTIAQQRDGGAYQATFTAGAEWKTVRIEFAALQARNGRVATNAGTPNWTGKAVLALGVESARPAGSFSWLELDNLALFR